MKLIKIIILSCSTFYRKTQ